MFSSALEYLQDPEIRALLSWLGGGIAVVCGGFWTVFTFLRKQADEQKANQANDDGAGKSIAFGALVTASSVTQTIVKNGLLGSQLVILMLAFLGLATVVSLQGGAWSGDCGISIKGPVTGNVTNQNQGCTE